MKFLYCLVYYLILITGAQNSVDSKSPLQGVRRILSSQQYGICNASEENEIEKAVKKRSLKLEQGTRNNDDTDNDDDDYDYYSYYSDSEDGDEEYKHKASGKVDVSGSDSMDTSGESNSVESIEVGITKDSGSTENPDGTGDEPESSTDKVMMGDLGNYFVYVNCKSCKVKSELVLKKGKQGDNNNENHH